MPGSKSSPTKNIVLGLLALWGLGALVLIVVWATHPDMRSAAQYRAQLQEATEKLEGAKVVWAKDKVALERLVEQEREQQEAQEQKIQELLLHLHSTNITLNLCRQETVVLRGNISMLEQRVEALVAAASNLTEQLVVQRDQVEVLQQNLTQEIHHTVSCRNLKDAARSEKMAAQSQVQACTSSKQFLEKQLTKCKETDHQKERQQTSENVASSLCSVPGLLLLSFSLKLLT